MISYFPLCICAIMIKLKRCYHNYVCACVYLFIARKLLRRCWLDAAFRGLGGRWVPSRRPLNGGSTHCQSSRTRPRPSSPSYPERSWSSITGSTTPLTSLTSTPRPSSCSLHCRAVSVYVTHKRRIVLCTFLGSKAVGVMF